MMGEEEWAHMSCPSHMLWYHAAFDGGDGPTEYAYTAYPAWEPACIRRCSKEPGCSCLGCLQDSLLERMWANTGEPGALPTVFGNSAQPYESGSANITTASICYRVSVTMVHDYHTMT